jgi:hypothetical protein
MLQQKHISERLDDSEKSKALGQAKEMCRRPQQSNYKKTKKENEIVSYV